MPIFLWCIILCSEDLFLLYNQFNNGSFLWGFDVFILETWKPTSILIYLHVFFFHLIMRATLIICVKEYRRVVRWSHWLYPISWLGRAMKSAQFSGQLWRCGCKILWSHLNGPAQVREINILSSNNKMGDLKLEEILEILSVSR